MRTKPLNPKLLAYMFDLMPEGEVIRHEGVWYDKNGNSYNGAVTRTEASAMAATNRDCTDCVNCSNCTRCVDCQDCVDCYVCATCVNCRDCDFCSNCVGYVNCKDYLTE